MSTETVIDLARVRALCRTGAARSARLAAGLSLRELADAVGVSPTSIMRWEEGACQPKGARALAYAGVLDRLMRPRKAS